MAVTAQFTDKFKDYLGDGGIDLNTADLRMAPLTNAYTFDAAHEFADDLSGEVTTNGGSRVSLSGESWGIVSNKGRFDCDDIVWTASGGSLTIRQGAMLDYTGSSGDSDRELLAVFSNDADLTAADGFDIAFQTPNGLFELGGA